MWQVSEGKSLWIFCMAAPARNLDAPFKTSDPSHTAVAALEPSGRVREKLFRSPSVEGFGRWKARLLEHNAIVLPCRVSGSRHVSVLISSIEALR